MRQLPTAYQQYIFLSRYARWLPVERRRETWPEAVERYLQFMIEEMNDRGYSVNCDVYAELEEAILNLEVMPSMRALMTAGPAAHRDNMCIYNCAYIPIDDTYAFDEVLNVLMCGTGVGFSVERRNIDKLPAVADDFAPAATTITVSDSREGWARALRQFISLLYGGQIPELDVSRVRKAGERLKTMGGRASGPEPLVKLCAYLVEKFRAAAGRQLTSQECHDVVCRIADCVIVGGVRRSALISLSDVDDQALRSAKFGQWWELHPERALANNSAVYNGQPSLTQSFKEWHALVESKSGERGIFNRRAAFESIPDRRERAAFGCNPCGEIILRPYGLCNLTEVVLRPGDQPADIKRKLRLATILGTWQSALTKFKHVRKQWQRNAEEERLLGVSLTGITDCRYILDEVTDEQLAEWRQLTIDINTEEAKKVGVEPSKAITCVKPSGTVSQLVDSSSGMHARFAKHYIKRVRQDRKDPLTQFMIDAGFPHEPEKHHPEEQMVFSFPVKAPEGAAVMSDMGAVEQLEFWKRLKTHWCEHNPSVTITVKESEWWDVGAWVYRNFDQVLGISFLPESDHTYEQLPYEAVDEAEYGRLLAAMPTDPAWDKLKEWEQDGDFVNDTVEFACQAGQCDI